MGGPGDTWYLDQVLITINGERHYLWRAVDQHGDVRTKRRVSSRLVPYCEVISVAVK
jgi:transposase-like protein